MRYIMPILLTMIFVDFSLWANDVVVERRDVIGGVEFCANEIVEKRTSYQVYPNSLMIGNEILEIKFDFLLYPYRNVGHIITCEGDNSELLNLIAIKPSLMDSVYLDLNLTIIDKKLSVPIYLEECNGNIWNQLKIGFSAEQGYAYISINGRHREIKFEPFELKHQYNITFGVCKHYLPLTPFSIKNLDVNMDGNVESFPLTESSGTIVHNASGDARGVIKNPIWVKLQHVNWDKHLELEASEISQIFLDKQNNKIVLYSSKHSVIYDITSKTTEVQQHNFKNAFKSISGGGCESYFNDKTGDLFIYNNLPTSKKAPTVAIYNYRNNSQQLLGRSVNKCRFHHHSLFTDSTQSLFYQFGGYGKYKYHNDFRVYSSIDKKWCNAEFRGDEIKPSYYTSVGTRLEENRHMVYIYGGYGNKSGEQRDGGEYFSHLYRIDPDKRVVDKVFDFDLGSFNKVPCRDLIIDDSRSQFYTMCYMQYKPQSYVQLYLFDWKAGEHKVVSDTIPLISTKISTQIRLFECAESNLLFCAIQEFTEINKSMIRLYSLKMPLQLTIQEHTSVERSKWWWLILLLPVGIGFKFRGYILPNIKKNQDKHPAINELPKVSEQVESKEEIIGNSIFLMGNFIVLDKNKVNVSYLFSSKIKQLFLLIFLYSQSKKDQGIHSEVLSSILWPDKTSVKSRNLRGVNIKKLRDILSMLNGIELRYSNSYWSVVIDRDVLHCDLLILNDQLDGRLDVNVSEQEIRQSLLLLRSGALLKYEQIEWLDSFKSDLEAKILTKYIPLMNQLYQLRKFNLSCEVAHVLLKVDPLNEVIAKIEVKSLLGLGDSVKASVRFRQFALYYYQTYDVNLIYETFTKES